jgi:hypothetical protein
MVDGQFQMNRLLVGRADGTTRLAVAELGGITVISGFALANGLLDRATSILILSSVALGVVAVFMTLRVALGGWRSKVLELGPRLNMLWGAIEEQGYTVIEMHLAVVATYQRAFDENDRVLQIRSRILVIASYLLAGSATVFIGALIYIIGGRIHA